MNIRFHWVEINKIQDEFLTLSNDYYEKMYAKNASNPMKKMVDVRCYVNVLVKASGGP